jgi:hypothetical protein
LKALLLVLVQDSTQKTNKRKALEQLSSDPNTKRSREGATTVDQTLISDRIRKAKRNEASMRSICRKKVMKSQDYQNASEVRMLDMLDQAENSLMHKRYYLHAFWFLVVFLIGFRYLQKESMSYWQEQLGMSADGEIPAVEDNVLVTEDNVTVTEDNLAVTEDNVAVGEDIVPAGEDIVLAVEDNMPAGEGNVPAGEDNVPLGGDDRDSAWEDVEDGDEGTRGDEMVVDEAVFNNAVVNETTVVDEAVVDRQLWMSQSWISQSLMPVSKKRLRR